MDGKLEIDFLYDYAPRLGDSFEILTCDFRVGEFSSIVGGDEGIVLMPTYTDTGLTLTVSDGSAPGEYVCAILNEDGTYTKYTALDDALEAVQEGETRTILLLKDIEYASAIIIKNKHITFDLNGYTLNVVNEEAELDTIEATSGLYVEGNATVELEDEGEFNVTGSRYGVFAECDIEQGEKPLVTVTSATGIGRYGVAAQGTKVTVHRYVISYGSDFEDEWAGVLADNGGEVIIGGSITAEGSANTGVYACDGGCVTVKGDVSVSDGEDDDGTGIYLDCSADEDESVVIIDGIIEADKYIVFYVFDGSVEETIEFDFQQGCLTQT